MRKEFEPQRLGFLGHSEYGQGQGVYVQLTSTTLELRSSDR